MTDNADERPENQDDRPDNADDRPEVRIGVLQAALANVPSDELKAALSAAPGVPSSTGVVARNAWNALRRQRDPAAVLGRPQYRAALPAAAASVSDECLARTIDVLGEHSDDPTRAQLLEALEEVRSSFSDTTVAVMLASAACEDLPSSRLCAELLAEDDRFGLTGVIPEARPAPAGGHVRRAGRTADASPEQRAVRRAKKERVKAERRRKAEVARLADDRVRQRRKEERVRPGPPDTIRPDR